MSKRLVVGIAMAAIPIIAIATSSTGVPKRDHKSVGKEDGSTATSISEENDISNDRLIHQTFDRVVGKKADSDADPKPLIEIQNMFASRSTTSIDSIDPFPVDDNFEEPNDIGDPYDRDIGKLWLVMVGVNDYSASRADGNAVQFADLKCAVNDVVGLTEAFVQVEIPTEQIISLHDNAGKDRLPTREHVVGALRVLAANESISPNDTLMFVFSGHGLNVNDTSHICLQDAIVRKSELGERVDVETEGTLQVNDLLDFMVDINAGTKILLSDACRNVSDGKKSNKVGAYNLSSVIKSMSNSDSGQNQVMIISSCLPGQISVERVMEEKAPSSLVAKDSDDAETESDAPVEEQAHGLFLGNLIAGLDGRAGFQFQGNHDDVLTMHELFQYASWTTIQEARNRSIRQDPFLESASSLVAQLVRIPDDMQERWQHAPITWEDELSLDQKTARKEMYPSALELLAQDREMAIDKISEAIELDPNHKNHYLLRRVANLMERNFVEAIEDSRQLEDPLKVRVQVAENSLLSLYRLNDQKQIQLAKTLANRSTLQIHAWSAADTTSGKEAAAYLFVSGFKGAEDKEFMPFDGWVKANELMVDRVATATVFHQEEQRVIHSPDSFRRTYSRPTYNQSYQRPAAAQFPRVQRAVQTYQNVETQINRANQILGGIPYAPRIPSLRGLIGI